MIIINDVTCIKVSFTTRASYTATSFHTCIAFLFVRRFLFSSLFPIIISNGKHLPRLVCVSVSLPGIARVVCSFSAEFFCITNGSSTRMAFSPFCAIATLRAQHGHDCDTEMVNYENGYESRLSTRSIAPNFQPASTTNANDAEGKKAAEKMQIKLRFERSESLARCSWRESQRQRGQIIQMIIIKSSCEARWEISRNSAAS